MEHGLVEVAALQRNVSTHDGRQRRPLSLTTHCIGGPRERLDRTSVHYAAAARGAAANRAAAAVVEADAARPARAALAAAGAGLLDALAEGGFDAAFGAPPGGLKKSRGQRTRIFASRRVRPVGSETTAS